MTGLVPSCLVIGALCEDIIRTEESTRRALGGTAYYFSAAFSALGGRVACVSKTSEAWMGRTLKDAGVDTRGVGLGRSCSYELDYERGERTLRLVRHSSRLEAQDIPRSMLACQGLHLGPIEDELGPSLTKLAGRFDLVTLDIQGLARTFSHPGGLVSLRSKLNSEAEAILRCADVVKFSNEEATALLGPPSHWSSGAVELRGRDAGTVIVTKGPEGASVYEANRAFSVPPYRSTPVDWTGAGDSFMAGFVFRRLQGFDSEDSSRFGSALAAAVIERPRPLVFPSLDDVIAKMSAQET